MIRFRPVQTGEAFQPGLLPMGQFPPGFFGFEEILQGDALRVDGFIDMQNQWQKRPNEKSFPCLGLFGFSKLLGPFPKKQIWNTRLARLYGGQIVIRGVEGPLERFRGSAIKRATYRGLRRNAALSLGNAAADESTDRNLAERALAMLRSVADDEGDDPVVREQAAWSAELVSRRLAAS